MDTKMKTIICANCGIEFCLPDDYIKRRKQDGESFYCPAGHGNVYIPSENDRLKNENRLLNEKLTDAIAKLEKAERQRDYFSERYKNVKSALKERERSIVGYKGYIGRPKSQHQKQLNT